MVLTICRMAQLTMDEAKEFFVEGGVQQFCLPLFFFCESGCFGDLFGLSNKKQEAKGSTIRTPALALPGLWPEAAALS